MQVGYANSKHGKFSPYDPCEQNEEQKLKQVCRALKRSKPNEGNFSRVKFEVQNKPRLKKKYSN